MNADQSRTAQLAQAGREVRHAVGISSDVLGVVDQALIKHPPCELLDGADATDRANVEQNPTPLAGRRLDFRIVVTECFVHNVSSRSRCTPRRSRYGFSQYTTKVVG